MQAKPVEASDCNFETPFTVMLRKTFLPLINSLFFFKFRMISAKFKGINLNYSLAIQSVILTDSDPN